MRMLKARYGKILDQAIMCDDKKTASLGRELNRQWGELWAYLDVEGAEPTNNAGERKIRPAVLWRKGSFGTQSDAGQRFVERSLSLAATAAQLGVNLFTYLHMACGQKILGQLVPPIHDWAAAQPARG
jgi:transposase